MKTLTDIRVVQIGEAIEVHWKEEGEPNVYRLAETASALGQAFALLHAEKLKAALEARSACWYVATDETGSIQRHLALTRHEAERLVAYLEMMGKPAVVRGEAGA